MLEAITALIIAAICYFTGCPNAVCFFLILLGIILLIEHFFIKKT